MMTGSAFLEISNLLEFEAPLESSEICYFTFPIFFAIELKEGRFLTMNLIAECLIIGSSLEIIYDIWGSMLSREITF